MMVLNKVDIDELNEVIYNRACQFVDFMGDEGYGTSDINAIVYSVIRDFGINPNEVVGTNEFYIIRTAVQCEVSEYASKLEAA